MKHGIKKVKFKKGRDANRSILRHLTLNFLKHGHIETTLKRAKVLKGHVDRLSYKAKLNRESDRNVLKKHLAQADAIKYMTDVVGPAFEKRTSGFVTISKLGPRQGDSAEMAVLEWIKPLKTEEKKETTKKIEKKKVTPSTEDAKAKKTVK